MEYQIGEGVRAAMEKHNDAPLGDEVFHPINANPVDQRFSTTPGQKHLYVAHKTYDTAGQHIGFEVYLCPKA